MQTKKASIASLNVNSNTKYALHMKIKIYIFLLMIGKKQECYSRAALISSFEKKIELNMAIQVSYFKIHVTLQRYK